MKRCPQCNRVETDETLKFCRVDGATLVSDSSSLGTEAGTAQLGSGSVANEIETSILPHRTDASIQRETARTTVLPDAFPITTQNLPKLKRRNPIVVIAIIAAVALGLAVVIVVAATLVYLNLRKPAATAITSIAVMPFENASGNADVEYLSDGMTETLITSLSQLPNLNVKGRASVFRYKGREDTKTLGKELGVQAVLYGRVIQRGDQLTLGLELLDAVTENVIWSGKYDRKQADVVSLQSEIARDVSNKLKTKLSGADVAKVEKGYTANPEAYRLYLQGRFYWNKRTEADLRRSIEYYNQAIALDPAYAQAYAGLASAYSNLNSYAAEKKPDEIYPKARAAAEKAMEIDPTLAEPHAALGGVLIQYEWNWLEAEKEFKRAIELDPSYPTAHAWYGGSLANRGRIDEGIAEQKRALELDPLSPANNVILCRGYMSAHRYDDAITQCLKTFDIDPNFPDAHRHLAQIYFLKGMYEQATDEMQKAGQVSEKDAADLKEAYRRSGERGFWQLRLELAEKDARAKNREIDTFDLAYFQLGAGNKEQALDSLEKAVANGRGHSEANRLRANPKWDPLRAEPRYKELLRKVGLPE